MNERCRELAACIIAAFAKLSMEKQIQVKQALERWDNEREAEATDPTFVPQLRPGLLSAEAADDLATLIEGLDSHYWCRHIDCGWIGLNCEWIHNEEAGGGQYRCPRCVRQYVPWKTSGGRFHAQKALVMYPTALSGARPEGAVGDVRIYLCEWPSAAEKNLENELKEIYAGIDQDVLQGLTVDQIKAEMVSRDRSVKRPHFARYTLQDNKRDRVQELIELNTKGKAASKPWGWRHLDNGFCGAHYIPKENETVLTYKDVMRMWGLSKYLASQAGAAQL